MVPAAVKERGRSSRWPLRGNAAHALGFDDAGSAAARLGPERLVIGSRRSRPKLRGVIFGPGGYWRRLYSARSTIAITRSTRAGSCPAATSSAAPMSLTT